VAYARSNAGANPKTIEAITSRAIVEQLSLDLLRPHFPPSRGVRLLGVTLSNFDATAIAENRQIALALR
jgi:DNA polymerase-4